MFANKLRWIAATLVLLLALTACGSNTGTGSSDPKDSSSTFVVEHAMGKTEVPENPQRVVILTNEGTEALLALGIKPVGAVKSWLGDPWYDYLADRMKGVEVVGTESDINLEAIAALEPDLIIGNKLRQEKWYDHLSQIAPTVFSETLRGDWKINFELYAKAVNREEKGQELMEAFDRRIKEIRNQLGDQVNQEISVVRFMPGNARIYYKDSFSGVILDQIGFKRPPTHDKQEFADEVTKERIPDMEGDVLFYFTYETGDGEAVKTEKEWTGDPLWKKLKVVKSGNAHKVSDAIWNTGGGILAANRMLDDIEKFFLKDKH
jgi:iron complex transport system substrate-binding protein